MSERKIKFAVKNSWKFYLLIDNHLKVYYVLKLLSEERERERKENESPWTQRGNENSITVKFGIT